MKQKYIIITLSFLLFGCSADRQAVISKKNVSVFEKEADAAYEGSLNREPATPIATLQEGEEVLVVRDTYGKDYWACEVKLKNNTSGWALCTNLKFKRGS